MSEERVDASRTILFWVIGVVFTVLISVIGYLYVHQGTISERVLRMESMSLGYVDVQTMKDRLIVVETGFGSYSDERGVVYATVDKEMDRMSARISKIENMFVLKMKREVVE